MPPLEIATASSSSTGCSQGSMSDNLDASHGSKMNFTESPHLVTQPSSASSLSRSRRRSTSTQSRTDHELAHLRRELCGMKVRCEELEQDRNYNAAKVDELQEIVQSYRKGGRPAHDNEPKSTQHQFNDSKETILQNQLDAKSLQVADLSMKVDELDLQLRKAAKENRRLRHQSESKTASITRLSRLIQSLQNVSSSGTQDKGSSTYEGRDGGTSVDMLTPERAFDLTLKNMKIHVEVLEDERSRLCATLKSKEMTINSLTRENEMKDVKLEMLEELFRSLNTQERCMNSAISSPRQEKSLKCLQMDNAMKDIKLDMLQELFRSLSNPSQDSESSIRTEDECFRDASTKDTESSSSSSSLVLQDDADNVRIVSRDGRRHR